LWAEANGASADAPASQPDVTDEIPF